MAINNNNIISSVYTLRRRRIFCLVFAGFVIRMEDTSLPKCVMFGELARGAGCVHGGAGNRVDGVFPGRPQSFIFMPIGINADQGTRLQPRTAQNGGTRGGTFHGEIGRCRGSQSWTTACSRMPERDGKYRKERIAQSKRVRTDSLALVD